MALKFLPHITIIIHHLQKYFETNPTLKSLGNPKIYVSDSSLFLENHEAFCVEINRVHSSHPHSSFVKISSKMVQGLGYMMKIW